MVDSGVVSAVQRYLATLAEQGLEPSFGVVFGSFATGQSRSDSDIDLLVVAERFDEPYAFAEVSLLWRVAARVDSRIEPVACGARQWTDDTANAIVEIARREGQKIAA